MRVLHVIEPAFGGAWRHVADLAIEQKQLGLDVTVLYSPTRSDKATPKDLANLKGANIDLHAMPMERSVGLHDVQAAIRLKRLIGRLGPFDVIHAHSSKAGALVRATGGRRLTRTIYTPHAFVTMSPEISKRAKGAYSTIERLLAKRCDMIIAVSKQELEHAATMGIARQKLVTIENGIVESPCFDRREMRERLAGAQHEDKVAIGFVGRFAFQKAPETALKAFSMMSADAQKKSILVMVGFGEMDEELKELAIRLGISSHVIWAGEMEGRLAMAGFDLFLMTSRYESCPYVLFEAAANGLPIVSTNVGTAPDLISEGESGFLSPVEDAKSLARSLETLVTEEQTRKRFAKAIRARSQMYTARRMAEQTVQVYRSLVGGSVPTTAQPPIQDGG